MTDVLIEREVIAVLERVGSGVLVERSEPRVDIITEAKQGPPGRDGDAAGGALLAVNQLSEFDTEPKKQQARANLGLQVIDGGTFN